MFISGGVCFALMGSGFVASRLNHRRTIVLALLILGTMLIVTSLSRTLLEMKICLVFLGIGAGLYFPSGIASITSLVRPMDWGKALAIHELAPNLSFVMAPLLAEFFTAFLSWRGLMTFQGLLTLFMAFAFARFGRGGEFCGEAPRPQILRVLLSQSSFWIMVIFLGLAIGAGFGVYTMIGLYLVAERGIDREWANTLVSLSRISGIVMALLAGWLVDWLGVKRAIGLFSGATGIMTLLLGWIPDQWIALVVFLQPMVAVCFFPAGFAAISRIVPAEQRNVAVSFVSPVAVFMGAGGIPKILGLLGDKGSFSAGFALIGCLMLASVILLFFLRLEDEK
jgi:NNP family nitrate/nitrite transporter-like MFS transporter